MFATERKVALFDIYPKIVPTRREVEFTLLMRDPHMLADIPCTLTVFAMNGGRNKPMIADLAYTRLEAPQSGFKFSLTLPSEQEYEIRIDFEEKKRPRGSISIYALEDDLLYRTPLIGDFHAHTYFSDGGEGPAFVAAEYRKNGYDFATITDHRRMQSSKLAVAALEDLKIPFKIYHGEEVHPYGIQQHVVNFAADDSINAYALQEKSLETWRDTAPTAEWTEEIKSVMASLTDLPEDVDAQEVASAMIVARRIREAGGMAILAHPHWLWSVNNVTDPTTRYLLEHGIFDALELIGGMKWYENCTQIAFYEDLREQGIKTPVVGSSDMHTCLQKEFPTDRLAYFTEERTLVFAKSNTRDDIIAAVKDLYSTTIYKHVGNYPRAEGGSYRLKLYATFLLRYYLPLRDELYLYEGNLLHDCVAGVAGAKEQLEAVAAYNTYFEKKYFYRP